MRKDAQLAEKKIREYEEMVKAGEPMDIIRELAKEDSDKCRYDDVKKHVEGVAMRL